MIVNSASTRSVVLSNKGSLARKSSDKNGAFQNDEREPAIFILHRKI